MLQQYINAALEQARYEIIKDDEPFYGEIAELPGVWTTAKTLEDCQKKLVKVIEGWILLRISKGLPVPEIDNLRIQIPEEV
jgi:predicted RNase H-like HicB family nuclease